jgi:ferredoxin
MARYRITHEAVGCIGCGNCVSNCPKFWEMKGEKSHLKGSKKAGNNFVLEVDDIACNQDAADGCPVTVIRIEKLK